MVGLKRRARPGAIPFSVLMLGVAWWSIGYSLELLAEEQSSKLLLTKIQYVGIVVVAPAWLAFAIEFNSGRGLRLKRLAGLLIFEPVLVLALVLTNELHGWFWTAHSLGIVRKRGPFKGHSLLLATAALVPWAANIMTVFGLFPGPIDVTPISFLFVGAVIAPLLFRSGLLDLVPIAREAVLEAMPSAVLVTDFAGRVVDYNPAAYRILGLGSGRGIGSNAVDLIPGMPSAPLDLEPYSLELLGPEAGETLYFDVWSHTVAGDHERVQGGLIMLRDVTAQQFASDQLLSANGHLETEVERRTDEIRVVNERLASELDEKRETAKALLDSNKQLAETLVELQQTQGQVVRQERLSALGQMASGVAHEFNNALSPIIGYSELLMIRPELRRDDAAAEEYLGIIVTAAKDAVEVVSRLSQFYREPANEELVPIDVDELVRQVVSMTQPRWKDQTEALGNPVVLEHPQALQSDEGLRDTPAVDSLILASPLS